MTIPATSLHDAAYAPAVLADWTTPPDVGNKAADELASRLTTLDADVSGLNASDIGDDSDAPAGTQCAEALNRRCRRLEVPLISTGGVKTSGAAWTTLHTWTVPAATIADTQGTVWLMCSGKWFANNLVGDTIGWRLTLNGGVVDATVNTPGLATNASEGRWIMRSSIYWTALFGGAIVADWQVDMSERPSTTMSTNAYHAVMNGALFINHSTTALTLNWDAKASVSHASLWAKLFNASSAFSGNTS